MPRRPGPIRWLWYAAGGTLPDAYRAWVLQDVTGRTRLLRHAARSTLLVGPLAAVWWLLPGPVGLHLAMSLLACLVGYFYSFAYMTESNDRRLVRHGYPPGTYRQIRAEATQEANAQALARYEELYRQG